MAPDEEPRHAADPLPASPFLPRSAPDPGPSAGGGRGVEPEVRPGGPSQVNPFPASPQTFTWPTEYNWGLDRIDQRSLPLSNSYAYTSTGQGVHVYILDTGVRDHAEFRSTQGFGPSRLVAGRNFVHHEPRNPNGTCLPAGATQNNGVPLYIDPNDTFDEAGHGTHVAGIAAGRWYGAAKEATIHPVRIGTACGTTATSALLSAIDWIYVNAVKPAVVNFSYNILFELPSPDPDANTSCLSTMGTAFRNLIAGRGILVVNSAGNFNLDAGGGSIPACLPEVLVVGATREGDHRWGPTSGLPCPGWTPGHDPYASYCGSAYGPSIDVFAPGAAIDSAGNASGGAVCSMTGTSMAAPHATGVAALYLQRHPTATPAQVHAAIVNGATLGALTGDLGAGSPNRLLYAPIDLP